MQAIKYALNGGKKDDSYIRMELMISCESLPLIDKKPPNTCYFMYLDQNSLDFEGAATDKGSSYTESTVKDNEKTDVQKRRYVEKLRSKVVVADRDPIYEESYTFSA